MTTPTTAPSEIEATLAAQRRAFALGAPNYVRRMDALASLRDAAAAGPADRAFRHGEIRRNRVQHDLHAEPEAHARCGAPELAVDHVARVIGRHHLDGARPE